jgi:uncharacterized protein DUF6680
VTVRPTDPSWPAAPVTNIGPSSSMQPYLLQFSNSIDLLFHKDKNVVDAWRIYHDHLTSLDQSPSDAQRDQWVKRDEDYLVELLAALSRVLGYDFDTMRLKRAIYAPRPCAAASTDNALRPISITPAQPRLSVARQDLDAQERCHDAAHSERSDGRITSKFSVSLRPKLTAPRCFMSVRWEDPFPVRLNDPLTG